MLPLLRLFSGALFALRYLVIVFLQLAAGRPEPLRLRRPDYAVIRDLEDCTCRVPGEWRSRPGEAPLPCEIHRPQLSSVFAGVPTEVQMAMARGGIEPLKAPRAGFYWQDGREHPIPGCGNHCAEDARDGQYQNGVSCPIHRR